MVKKDLHLVTVENGPRPAGKPDRCFYCGRKVGAQHATDCVCRKRTVVVRTVIEHVVSVPESWEASQIDFLYQGSSSCADNILDNLIELQKALPCMCGRLSSSYVREATENDERADGL